MTIRVSVVIPYYGEREALEGCLRALEGQTLDRAAFEVIVVNNRPDRPLTLDRMGAIVVDEARPGSYAARNRGVQLARGEWLAFTDTDCVPDERWLEAGLRHAAQHDPLGGHIQLVMTDPRSLAEKYDMTFGLNQKNYVEKSGFAATANLVVSRSTFDRVGPFSPTLRSGGDVEWCRRAARAGFPVTYCAEAIVAHPTRTSWRAIIRKALRVQGGTLALQRQFQLELPVGACRAWVDAIYPRLYVARLLALRKAGDRTWWRLYLMACVVSCVAAAESFRLRLGGTPLR